jgi:uncharacterized membrane protein
MDMTIANNKIAGNHVIVKALNILLPLAGAGIMYFYEYCDTACASIKGTFLGIDLKYTGMLFMAALLITAFLNGKSIGRHINNLRTLMISSAIGAEFILIRFQVVNDVYCQYCLVFATSVFVLFAVNFTSMNKKLMAASMVAGIAGFMLFFKGQVVPLFDLSFLRLLC